MNKSMSKSQKRKQRLIRKGEMIAQKGASVVSVQLPSNTKVNSNFGQSGKSRSARRRSKRRSGPQSSGPDSYLKALMNPESSEGAKVPDAIGYPTGTFQLEKIGTLSTGATAGDSIGIEFRPVVGDGTSVFPIVTYNGTTVGSLSQQASINWPSRAGVVGLFGNFRPVSASLEVSFYGNSTADGGRLTCGTTYVGNGTPGSNFDNFSNQPGMSIWPAKNGARVVWKPIDNTNFEFVSSFTPKDRYPCIAVAVTGLPINTAVFQYRAIANFEGIPISESASLLELKPSPVSLESLNKAFEWAQKAGNSARPLIGVIGTALEMGANIYAQTNRLRSTPGMVVSRSSGLVNYPKAVQSISDSVSKIALGVDENNNNNASSYERSRDVLRDQTPPSGRDLGRTSSGPIPRSPLPEGRFYQ